MIKYRSRLRILLITFLAGVFLTNVYARVNSYMDAMTAEVPTIKVDELRIKLPVIRSDSPLIVRPETDKFNNRGRGSAAGGGRGGGNGLCDDFSTKYFCDDSTKYKRETGRPVH